MISFMTRQLLCIMHEKQAISLASCGNYVNKVVINVNIGIYRKQTIILHSDAVKEHG